MAENHALPYKSLGSPDIAGFLAMFQSDSTRWDLGDFSDEDIAAAAGYWMFYPTFLDLVGDWRSEHGRLDAYRALNHVHDQATHALMVLAESNGIQSGPLWECAKVCQEIYASGDGWIEAPIGNTQFRWPDCIRHRLKDLSPRLAETIQRGEATFVSLSAKLAIKPRAPDGRKDDRQAGRPTEQARDLDWLEEFELKKHDGIVATQADFAASKGVTESAMSRALARGREARASQKG